MDDHEKVTNSAQLRPPPRAQTAVGAPAGTTATGFWKVIWPLVAGGLVIAGGTLIAKRLGIDGRSSQPSYLTSPPSPSPAAEAPRLEATPLPKVAEVDPYEDALRPEGNRIFLGYCRDMDEAMNLKGVEELARKRIGRVPDSYMAWAVIGYVSEWRNEPEGAQMAYRNAKNLLDHDGMMARQPVQVRAEAEMICTGKAGIYLFCRNDEDARFVTCRKAVVDHPNDDGAWFVLGFTAASRQNFMVMSLCEENLQALNPDKAKQFKEACVEPMKARLEMMRQGGAR